MIILILKIFFIIISKKLKDLVNQHYSPNRSQDGTFIQMKLFIKKLEKKLLLLILNFPKL